MGNNDFYTLYEGLVIRLYDLGVLNRSTLDAVMKDFFGTHIDHGGSMDLRSKDNLSADEIVIKIARPDKWAMIEERKHSFMTKHSLSNYKEIESRENRWDLYDEWFDEVDVGEEWSDWYRKRG